MAKPAAISVTIPAGEALSSSAELSRGTLSMILLPTNWQPAHLSFQISADDSQFRDLVDEAGNEVTRLIAGGCAMPVGLQRPQCFIRLRSGSRDGPVPQAAACVVTLLTI